MQKNKKSKSLRCAKHLWDQSSNIGVCATCLRHRLFSLPLQYHHTPPLNPPLPTLSSYIFRCKSDHYPQQSNKNLVKMTLNSDGKFALLKNLKSKSSKFTQNSRVSRVTSRNIGMSPASELAGESSSPVTRPRPSSGACKAACFRPLVSVGGGKLRFSGKIRVPATLKSTSTAAAKCRKPHRPHM
ncbi:hypothetical protein RND81_02G102500 [Saponaria officinalis]|uniref:Uncharacterized protein n=1 Tax=Saponaria officinalis TaxID=3572 RepID=A0AAW1MRP8_SAPOF